VRRIWLPAAVFLVFLVIIRFIVLPLALQRSERRAERLPILSELPADTRVWILSRNSHRRFPADLWPESPGFALRQAREMGFPQDAVEKATGLRLFGTGEWLYAQGPEGRWCLLGPLSQFMRKVPEASAITEDTVSWRGGGFFALARGSRFLLSDSEESLAPGRGSWLSSLPRWSELGDLLMAGDLILFRSEGGVAALGALRVLDGMILAEGLGWGGAGPQRLLDWADPLERPESALENGIHPPLLRSSPPWDEEGGPMHQVETRAERGPEVTAALRLWIGGDRSAYSHVIAPTDSR